tara:strand:- start:1335 stop:1688 length:354 start_codon:yes stop_codon:yes gene_type:complete
MISLGASFGANARFFIVERLILFNKFKDFKVIIVNLISVFLLGIFFPNLFQNNNVDIKFYYYFLIGFLSSFSTYSSFIYNLFTLLKKRKFKRCLFLIIISLICGITIFNLGYSMARI